MKKECNEMPSGSKSYLPPVISVVDLEMKLCLLVTATMGTPDMENEDF